MVLATNLGYPRIGPRRELKWALERFWAGKIREDEMLQAARDLRKDAWLHQQEDGLDHIPSNDFSLYDHVLDTIAMVGAVPSRYGWSGKTVDLRTCFAMARGIQEGGVDIAAMEMTKWFDTNYHYIVPEFEPGQRFRLASPKPVDMFCEAKALGVHTRPVLLGPVSFLLLGKATSDDVTPLDLLPNLLPIYEHVLRQLADAGATWVQIDEPCLVLDLTREAQQALLTTYEHLADALPTLRLLLATYFGDLRDNLPTAMQLPVAALHIDLVRAPAQLAKVLPDLPECMALSLGVVDGRNIWRTDLERALDLVEQAVHTVGKERVLIGPSCSMLHAPIDLDLETAMDEETRRWFAFAKQKVVEISLLTHAANVGREACEIADLLAANHADIESRRTSPRIHNPAIKQRVAAITDQMRLRANPYPLRRAQQCAHLELPLFPTTTIGSFPQTKEIRAARANFKAGNLTAAEYDEFLQNEMSSAVRIQEEIGLDVLVHGEFERNDMVEYFGEQLTGYMAMQHGWVQSYGSRGVKPPIIYGDVSRPHPMTVEWARRAQALTSRPMKGMLTGPVTMLQWAFVRDDQPRSETCRQIALAIRDEVCDLEAAGIGVVQIDEPAIREGLPLRSSDWGAYLDWAVDCFRIASAGVRDETQIHTHMCYSEFNDIIEAIAALDADVISIETSRSRMELLDAFVTYRYPNEIGPGVYDIHSPRIPSTKEMVALLEKALEVLSAEQIWVNPDCGLKTRRWEEVRPALANMVAAARALREQVVVEK